LSAAGLAREGRVVRALGRRAPSVQFRRAQLLMPTFVLPLMREPGCWAAGREDVCANAVPFTLSSQAT